MACSVVKFTFILCYVARSVLYISNTDTVETVYFENIHSITNCVIILGRTWACSQKIFPIQKNFFEVWSKLNLEIHVEVSLRG
jgi:hypothetical protein